MRGALRPIPVGPVLEIGFKDSFEDQLECALYDSIPDGRN
jgi:hypothetical protein